MSAATAVSLSVIIPTYDEPKRLEAAIKSLAAQDYLPQLVELIVVDDASPHFDPDGLRAAAESFPLKFIRHETNQGRARARNRGVEAAGGDIIVFLDSDMTVKSDFLQAHATAHRLHPGSVVIGNILFGDQIPDTCLSHYIDSRGVHRLKPEESVPFKCFVTGNSSVQREQPLQVGLFDESFTAYGGEDLELGYRLHLHGMDFRYAPQALSFHNHLRALEQICQLMYTYGNKSLPLLLQKHPTLSPLLRLGFLEMRRFYPRRLFLRLALTPVVFAPIFLFARCCMERYVPDLVFDYLWWYKRTRGYLDSNL